MTNCELGGFFITYMSSFTNIAHSTKAILVSFWSSWMYLSFEHKKMFAPFISWLVINKIERSRTYGLPCRAHRPWSLLSLVNRDQNQLASKTFLSMMISYDSSSNNAIYCKHKKVLIELFNVTWYTQCFKETLLLNSE